MNYKNQPKILILNQMAGPMTWELAEDFSKEIGCVALLTGHPDTLKKESSKTLQLHPAPTYHRGSFPRRAISWLAYCFKAFFWILKYPTSTPILIFSNPPILLWFVWFIHGIRKQKYAIMVHDIYPDILVRLQGFSEKNLLIRVWRFLNRHAYQKAQLVMTLGEYMAANLEKQFDSSKTAAGKVEIVYPWVDTEKIHPIPKEENWFAKKYDQVGKLTVMYSGNMGLGHDIETILETAKILENHEDINFLFIGDGPKKSLVEKFLHRSKLQNIISLDWQDEKNLSYSLTTSNILIVSIEPGLEGFVIPSKTFSGLAAGSMIVVLSKFNSELNDWLEETKKGIFIPPGDPINLTKIVLNYKNKYSQTKNRSPQFLFVDKQFSRKKNCKNLINLIRLFIF